MKYSKGIYQSTKNGDVLIDAQPTRRIVDRWRLMATIGAGGNDAQHVRFDIHRADGSVEVGDGQHCLRPTRPTDLSPDGSGDFQNIGGSTEVNAGDYYIVLEPGDKLVLEGRQGMGVTGCICWHDDPEWTPEA